MFQQQIVSTSLRQHTIFIYSIYNTKKHIKSSNGSVYANIHLPLSACNGFRHAT